MKFAPTWLASLFLLFASTVYGQELNCIVVINADNAPNVDSRQKEEMQASMAQFMNQQVWTQDRYEPQERISCIINFTVESVANQTFFRGTATIQASRPVYGTSYETLLVRYFDQGFEFEYNPGQVMNYNENAYTNDIVALLSFYAHIILAFDYDSFSPLGGDPYFQQAFNIATLAQGSGGSGWDQFANNGRNRYQFANLLANGQFNELRESWYTYHLEAMDTFLNEPDEARTKLVTVLEIWQQANRQRPANIVNQVIMDTKADELVQVYSEGEQPTRQQAYDILVTLDPTRTSDFDKMMEGR